jgi:hypothetical protein
LIALSSGAALATAVVNPTRRANAMSAIITNLGYRIPHRMNQNQIDHRPDKLSKIDRHRNLCGRKLSQQNDRFDKELMNFMKQGSSKTERRLTIEPPPEKS